MCADTRAVGELQGPEGAQIAAFTPAVSLSARGSAGAPAPRRRASRLRVSNQNGAPSMRAATVMAHPARGASRVPTSIRRARGHSYGQATIPEPVETTTW
jgi:hypothetical protein